MVTRFCGWVTGSDRSSRLFTREKIVVFAPMPSASDKTARWSRSAWHGERGPRGEDLACGLRPLTIRQNRCRINARWRVVFAEPGEVRDAPEPLLFDGEMKRLLQGPEFAVDRRAGAAGG